MPNILIVAFSHHYVVKYVLMLIRITLLLCNSLFGVNYLLWNLKCIRKVFISTVSCTGGVSNEMQDLYCLLKFRVIYVTASTFCFVQELHRQIRHTFLIFECFSYYVDSLLNFTHFKYRHVSIIILIYNKNIILI